MPTLPPQPETPAGPAERIGSVLRRGQAALGVDRTFTLRLLVWLMVLAAALMYAPLPARLFGALALLGLVIDVARTTQRERHTR